jgi:hypothetical protein
VRDAIARIVTYNWKDEEADYAQCGTEPGGNTRAGHVFESLTLMNQWLTSAPTADDELSRPLGDYLYGFETRQSDDDVKIDLELIHTQCGEHLCDVEHGDTMDTLARVVLGHECS